MGREYEPMTPGRFLQMEFLEPMEMTPYTLAKALRVDPPRVNQILTGKREITADTATRLARLLGTSARYWLNLQNRYDLAKVEDESGERIEHEVRTLVTG